MRIAVAGGTGVVGRYVVEEVRRAGHEPVVLARSVGVDVRTGVGLDAALDGVSVVIDVTSVTAVGRRTAVGFFTGVTQRLLTAGRASGVRHHVVLSIVGVDRVDFGYYVGKRRQEELVLDADLPASVLRATQFHEFAAQTLARSRGPVAVVPRMKVQTIAAREVAAALVELAVGPAAGLAPDLAGPEPAELVELTRQVLAATGRRRLVVPMRLPGAGGRAMATGALLPAGPHRLGRQTFASWLAESGGRLRVDAGGRR